MLANMPTNVRELDFSKAKFPAGLYLSTLMTLEQAPVYSACRDLTCLYLKLCVDDHNVYDDSAGSSFLPSVLASMHHLQQLTVIMDEPNPLPTHLCLQCKCILGTGCILADSSAIQAWITGISYLHGRFGHI